MSETILHEESDQIIGAAIEVYCQLGCGFLEPIYQEALQIELTRRHIAFEPQIALTVHYKGQALEKTYKPDFICFGGIVVELKACHRLSGREVAQLLNYMKATRMRVGLLFNFGSAVRLEWKRYVL
jgi:GxxExxY protein